MAKSLKKIKNVIVISLTILFLVGFFLGLYLLIETQSNKQGAVIDKTKMPEFYSEQTVYNVDENEKTNPEMQIDSNVNKTDTEVSPPNEKKIEFEEKEKIEYINNPLLKLNEAELNSYLTNAKEIFKHEPKKASNKKSNDAVNERITLSFKKYFAKLKDKKTA